MSPFIIIIFNSLETIGLVNNTGKPRLTKFYSNQFIDRTTEFKTTHQRSQTVKRIYEALKNRSDSVCNLIKFDPHSQLIQENHYDHKHKKNGEDNDLLDLSIVYRHYATLYFVMIIDKSESELGSLDLIQVFVECLDKCFKNVCELDLIFHYDQLNHLLSQMILGGIVIDTNVDQIVHNFKMNHQLSSSSNNNNSNTNSNNGLVSSASSIFSHSANLIDSFQR